MPKFSVVIPLYNKERHIQRAVNSVLAQTFKDFELIIVDDGSTDSSLNIVQNYDDKRIRLIQQKNAGECAARNTGIRNSHYDLVAFLDADDAWRPEYLKTILDLSQNFPEAGAYSTNYKRVDPNGREYYAKIKAIPSGKWEGIIPDYFHSIALGESPITPRTACIRKEVFYEIGKFKEGVKLYGDLDMWARLVTHYPIAYSSKACATYFRDAENRAMNIFLPNDEIPFKGTILSAIKNGEIKGYSVKYAMEFIAKYTYLNATICLFANKTDLARHWIKKIESKRYELKFKKFILFVLSFLPYALVKRIRCFIRFVKTILMKRKQTNSSL
jgi:glycosyltransferase involved in cell wall biosynthesis